MHPFRNLQSLQHGAGSVDLLPRGSGQDWLFGDAVLLLLLHICRIGMLPYWSGNVTVSILEHKMISSQPKAKEKVSK